MKHLPIIILALLLGSCQKNEVLYPSSIESQYGFTDFKAVDEEELHYVILVKQIGKLVSPKEKDRLKAFSQKHFKGKGTRISNIFLGRDADHRYPIYVIRRFNGKKEALGYYQKLKEKSKKYLPKSCRASYAISQNNYRTILKNRSIDGYQEFFQEHYLNEN